MIDDQPHIRPAEKAGAWYSANPEGLRRELDQHLERADIDRAVPCVAGIVPHAGLAFSGPSAARVYAWMAGANPDIRTFLVFGAVHTMHLSRPAIWARGAWDTPLGQIAVDRELAAALIAAGVGEENESPHFGDNAIELQTPFLRHCFPKAEIVAIATPANSQAADTGTATWEIARKTGHKIMVLGSTDLTHYGAAFGLTPAGFGDPATTWCRQNDEKLLRLMADMRAEEIVPAAARDHSACGAGAVAATVAFARAAGCAQGLLLEHTTSYEVMPDGEARHFVGYGAMVFPA